VTADHGLLTKQKIGYTSFIYLLIYFELIVDLKSRKELNFW